MSTALINARDDDGPESTDTGNTEVEDLTAPLDPDDDVFRMLTGPDEPDADS